MHQADARNQARAGRLVIVETAGSKGRELNERAALVEEPCHTLARQELAAGNVPFARPGWATEGRRSEPLAKVVDEGGLRALLREKRCGCCIHSALQNVHGCPHWRPVPGVARGPCSSALTGLKANRERPLRIGICAVEKACGPSLYQ